VSPFFDDDAVVEGLVVPDELSSRLMKLHVLGAAGVSIQRAIVAFEASRTGVFTEYAYLRYGGTYSDPETGEEFDMAEPENANDLFDYAIGECIEAAAQLQQILET